MRRGQVLVGFLVLVAAGLTLAACGGKSDDSSSDEGGGSGAEKGPITIGVTAEKTGPVPILGTATVGVQKAANYINQHGGIDGRQIKLVIRDNAGDPSKAVTQVREFTNDGVKVILGGWFGADCAAEGPVVAKADVIAFCGSTDNLPDQDEHMFGIGLGYTPTIEETTKVIAQYATNKKAAVFADKDKSGDDTARIGPEDLKKLGVTPQLERTDPTAASFKPAIQRAIANGNSVLWFSQCTPAVVTAVGEAQALGFKGKIMLENCLASLDVAQALKAFAKRNPQQIIVQAPELLFPEKSSNPDRAKAIALYKQVVGKPDTVQGSGWDTMWLAKAAIEKAGSTDTDKLLKTLEDNFQFTGVWHGGAMTAEDHRGAQPEGYVVPAYFTPQGTLEPLQQ